MTWQINSPSKELANRTCDGVCQNLSFQNILVLHGEPCCHLDISVYMIIRDCRISVIEGAHIHIFGFTQRENNQFQKKLIRI